MHGEENKQAKLKANRLNWEIIESMDRSGGKNGEETYRKTAHTTIFCDYWKNVLRQWPESEPRENYEEG